MATLDVEAPMSGTVLEVVVSIGDTVALGDEVVILESMKMELPVESPGAGAVAEIAIAPGDRVDEGTLLLRLER